MQRTQHRLVVGRNGLRARVLDELTHPGGTVTLRLEDGGQFVVPVDALVEQPDGSFLTDLGPDELTSVHESSTDGRETIGKIPIIEESARVEKRVHETGSVVVYVTPHEHTQAVDVPLVEEQVDVRRVPINRFIDAPAATRQEGETTVVPVMEEVLVVEKKLMLREEVHVTRRRVTTHERQNVTLRKEEARVLRSDDTPPAQ